jgi:hypothetical protein
MQHNKLSQSRRNEMKTYSTKAAAKKGAVRQELDVTTLEFHQNEEGRWYWEIVRVEESGTGIKIEKDRPEQNGIRRPSAGGKCRAIWDACDALHANGAMPMPKVIKELAQENGWNENNAVIEMYQWRKFHGIIGRQK